MTTATRAANAIMWPPVLASDRRIARTAGQSNLGADAQNSDQRRKNHEEHGRDERRALRQLDRPVRTQRDVLSLGGLANPHLTRDENTFAAPVTVIFESVCAVTRTGSCSVRSLWGSTIADSRIVPPGGRSHHRLQ